MGWGTKLDPGDRCVGADSEAMHAAGTSLELQWALPILQRHRLPVASQACEPSPRLLDELVLGVTIA